MSLQQLRKIADERTDGLTLTPEMRRRVLDAVAEERTRPRRSQRKPLLIAAACLVLMALSAGVMSMNGMFKGPDSAPVMAANPAQHTDVSTELLGKDVGDFAAAVPTTPMPAERFEARQHEPSGFYGIYDLVEDGWMYEPIYTRIGPIGDYVKVVLQDGSEANLPLAGK